MKENEEKVLKKHWKLQFCAISIFSNNLRVLEFFLKKPGSFSFQNVLASFKKLLNKRQE